MVVAVLTNGCRHFDLCLVAVLTTIVAVLVCCLVAVLDLSPFWLSPFRLVAVLTCIHPVGPFYLVPMPGEEKDPTQGNGKYLL